MAAENTLLILLLILTAGLIIPEFLRKFRLPFITLIILAGSILGPNGFNYVAQDNIIEFFGFLGMAFLMVLAGLEVNITRLAKSKYKIFVMAFLNGFIPFLVGVTITRLFNYSWTTSILVGIVFISSSVAVIIPSLQGKNLVKKNSAQLILSAILLADIISLIALGIIFQNVSKITDLPLIPYFLILILSIMALFYFIPKVSNYTLKKKLSQDEGHERRIRFVMIILIGILVYFSILGVHTILAAFLAGLALSGVVMNEKSRSLYTKLHTLGYGLFVPVFFFVVGMEMDIGLIINLDVRNIIMVSLILGLIISKFISGYMAGRIVKLPKKDSLVFGSISITQLTTTLAVTYAASTLNILDSTLTTSIILLSIVTTFLGPILASRIK